MVEEECPEPTDISQLALTLPGAVAANQKSFFVVGLHKAGSTLLTEMFRKLARGYRYVPYNLHQDILELGLRPPDVVIQPDAFFQPFGYAFIGFRGWDPGHALPIWSRQRVVLLVRDPRDVLVSMYYSIAMSHIAPTGSSERSAKLRTLFEEDRRTSAELDVDGFALAWADRVYKEYADTLDALQPAAPKVWRYEDVIFNKLPWVKDMLCFLGMEPPPDDILREIIRPFDVIPDREQPEKHIRQVKPGDHKAKLAAATIEQLTARFAPVLRTFGYS